MGLHEGFTCCYRQNICHGFTLRYKILLFILLFFLLEPTESTFSDQLSKMLRGPSQHGKKVPRWNPDAQTKARVKRALQDTPTAEYEDFVYYGNEDCPENLKYEFRDIFLQSYKGPVCDIIDARNSAEQMKDLENCVIVNGFVHLVFMHDLTEADLEKYRFPKLRVITHYLLIFRMYNLKSLRRMFPNLAVIGGQELLKDYSLVLYENPHMKEIGLKNLQFINRGGVRIQKNPMLCYLSTISWERLGSYSDNKYMSEHLVMQDNRDPDQCVDQCGDSEKCVDENGQQLCWGLNICQKKLCPPECRHACMHGKCRCHDECLAGCTRANDPTACFACRNKYHNGTCLNECPKGTYLIHEWLCIQKEECQKLDWNFYENKCQYSCPHGYQVNVTECMNVCTKCTSNCGQVCPGDIVVSDYHSLHHLEGCREIDGTLTISINGGSEVVERLDDALKDVEVIGSLVVRRSFPLVTLNFLRNIKRITGKHMEQEIYSIYILENKNLKELWNFTEKGMVVEAGKAFFHFNPHLCLSEVRKVEHLTPEKEDDKDISDTTNGDKATCHFLPIKILDVQINEEPFVKIYWENFIVNDDRMLIGYQVFYKESPEKNAKKNEGVDACRLNSWTIVDKPKSDAPYYSTRNGTMIPVNVTQPGKTSKLLSDLKAYTQYAYYVQAYTTSNAQSGGASDIQYFMTKPGQPTQPRNLRSTATTTSSINITWDIPESPNGRITHYIIEWKRQEEEDLLSIRSINTCKRGYPSIKLPPKKATTPKPAADKTSKNDDEKTEDDDNKQCKCECDKDILTKEDEEEAQESSEFENYLQDAIFFAPVTDFDDYESIEDMEMIAFPDEFLYRDANDTERRRRKRRSIVRRSSGFFNTTKTNETSTSTIPSTTTSQQENQTTPEPEDPAFMKHRIIVEGDNKATLTGLHYFSEYNIQVYACNHASDPHSKDMDYKIKDTITNSYGPRPKYTKCSIEAMTMTRTAPNKSADVIPPGSIKVMGKEHGMAEGITRLYWKMPLDPNAYISYFTIEVTPADKENAQPLDQNICVHVNTSVTDAMSYDIASGSTIPPGSYTARIKPTSLSGEGNWSQPVAFEIVDVRSQDTVIITVVLSVAAIVILAVITSVVIYVKTKKNLPNHSGTYEDYNPEYARYVYIPDEYEIDIEKVTILEEIGHGNFGKVFSGIAKSIVKDQEETKVAIKKLHENAMPSRRFEFLKEASMMKAFNAHHVVRLLGVVSQSSDPMVIMEYMEKGDLKSYLRSRRENAEENSQHLPPPTLQDKLQMAAEIADGMAYLAAYKFVHRDLAARNCLVDEHGTVKIGDFGLTRDIYETDYYRKESRGFLPIRWMAPESLKDGVFDSRSDVWSYGVVLWELATLAEQPYQGQQHDEVTRYVIDGGYMERPRNCPKRLYDLMTCCWQYNPKMRPVFIEIVQALYNDVNAEFREVCFYGKHDQEGHEEEDDSQLVHPHENNSEVADALYLHNDIYIGPSPGNHVTESNSLQPSWNAGDHSFKPHKNSVKSGHASSTPPRTETDEKQGLLEQNDDYPPSADNRSLNTTSTTAPRTPPSTGGKRTRRNRYSSESLYENDYEDDSRAPQSREHNARDSGAYISTNLTPKMGDKDPCKYMNGGHKISKDLELDLESGVDEGMWGNSSTASPSNPSTPTEMDTMLPSVGQNDNSIVPLLRPTASSNC